MNWLIFLRKHASLTKQSSTSTGGPGFFVAGIICGLLVVALISYWVYSRFFAAKYQKKTSPEAAKMQELTDDKHLTVGILFVTRTV